MKNGDHASAKGGEEGPVRATSGPVERPRDLHREVLDAPAEASVPLIESQADLERLSAYLAECSQVAIDTEANSMFVYREQTCIVQVTAGDRSAIIDVLAVENLSPLRDALDRDDVEVVLHGGDYDITVLTRDHDFRFFHVFDTMIAATLLGDIRVGLADLVRDHFGDQLNKKYQRADWGRRPLTDAHLDYLRRDTLYLPLLRAHYGERLTEAGLTEEAEIEFRRLACRLGKPAAFDPEAWRRIKGSARLSGEGRAMLVALFHWREQEARRRDLPPFKVLSPRALLALAESQPLTIRRPQDLRAMGDRDRHRHGRAVFAAMRRAAARIERGDVPAAKVAARHTQEELRSMRADRKVEERFKDWRRKEATRRKAPNVVVLPNPAVTWLIAVKPRTVDALHACPDIGGKRIERYGETLLALLGG